MHPVLEISPVPRARCQSSVKFSAVLVDRSRGFPRTVTLHTAVNPSFPGTGFVINNNRN